MQQLLIRYMLDPLAKIMIRIPQKVKDMGFVAFFLCIILLYFGRGSGHFGFRYVIFYGFGCLGLGGMILCSLPVNIKVVVFRKSLLLLWLGIGVLMFVSGVLYSVDYLPEAMLFLVAYPVIFVVWNQGNSTKILRLLFTGVELSFWAYTLVCLLFYPVEDARYNGIFTNVNAAAGYLAVVAVCLLVDCLWEEKLTAKQIRKLIAFGLCTALLLYTGSRTGILEMVVVAVVAVLVGVIRIGKRSKRLFFRNILLIAAAVVLFFSATIYILQIGYNTKNSVAAFVRDVFTEEPIAVSDSTIPNDAVAEDNLPGSSTLDNKPISAPSQPLVRPEDSAGVISERLDTNERDAEQFSSGRIQIWKGYLKQLNLFGHPDSGTVTFIYDGVERVYHTTHMTILQVAYENGIIAGSLYLIFNLTAGVTSLFYALRNKNNRYAMIPLLVSVAYGVYSVLANTGISFWYLATLMYYLVQFPIMIKSQDAQGHEETGIP